MLHLMDVKTDNVTDYKKVSMLIAFPKCSGKCEGCQSKHLLGRNNVRYKVDSGIINTMYQELNTHKAIVMAGLEPFDSFNEVLEIIETVVSKNKAVDIVIYTGYTEEEYKEKFEATLINTFIKSCTSDKHNLYVKVGRYDAINNNQSWHSDYLGINLATNNQCVYHYTSDGIKEIEYSTDFRFKEK